MPVLSSWASSALFPSSQQTRRMGSDSLTTDLRGFKEVERQVQLRMNGETFGAMQGDLSGTLIWVCTCVHLVS